MAKRVELSIDDYIEKKERPTARVDDSLPRVGATAPPVRPEPTTTLQARVSYSLADRLRDLARVRSRGGQKVSINSLLIEAVERYLDQEGG